jgi:hypothetical protein
LEVPAGSPAAPAWGSGSAAVAYFHLSWRDNEPVIRSEFSNPDVVKFH